MATGPQLCDPEHRSEPEGDGPEPTDAYVGECPEEGDAWHGSSDVRDFGGYVFSPVYVRYPATVIQKPLLDP